MENAPTDMVNMPRTQNTRACIRNEELCTRLISWLLTRKSDQHANALTDSISLPCCRHRQAATICMSELVRTTIITLGFPRLERKMRKYKIRSSTEGGEQGASGGLVDAYCTLSSGVFFLKHEPPSGSPQPAAGPAAGWCVCGVCVV